MKSTQRARGTPPPSLDLATVMRTLGEPVRLQIVALLADGTQRTSGEIADLVDLPASTCSYHLKQLVGSGITECWSVGTARYPTLRRQALEDRFPGLLRVVLDGLDLQQT